MSFKSPFHKALSKNRGEFNGADLSVSTDSINWIHLHLLSINNKGQMISSDENGGSGFVLLQSLQSCYVQVFPNLSSKNQQQNSKASKRKFNKANGSNDSNGDEPPVVFIKTYDNEKLYIRIPSKSKFLGLLASLVVWQSLKPQGLVKKWYCENKVDRSTITSAPHELLVCRCKIYGPITSKSKNIKTVAGPKVPIYEPKLEFQDVLSNDNSISNSNVPSNQNDHINEGWFYTMAVLKSDGSLNFLAELDGTLLYSIDMKSIMASEIRQMHHSIFENSNVLFVGQLKELRYNNLMRSTSPVDSLLNVFLTRDGKVINSNRRVLIEFPLHIDLEDWFVGLNYFSKREYIGSYMESYTFPNSQGQEISESNSFEKESFRVSKKVTLDIIEAKFDDEVVKDPNSKIYAEVVMWGLPWARTVIVNYSQNPFWKEEFSTDLPILTQMIHVLIKKCSFNGSGYLAGDKVIGKVYITPDILSKKINAASTMMSTSTSGNLMNNSSLIDPSGTSNNDIVRLSIYDSSNISIGKLVLTVNLRESHILSPSNFKVLENMLSNAPMKDLIKYCNKNVPTTEFESVSLMLLDIFQSLGVEDQWFKSLMEEELVNVDKMTRKNYVTNKRLSDNAATSATTSSSNNVFNTLFRGSSIFSKSLERYNLRVGQEYLEKVFGDFFARISEEEKNCEIDPRYIRSQLKAMKKGVNSNDSDYDSDSDDLDSDEEEELEEQVKITVDKNFNNLLGYIEDIWNKIYITSNDLPQQIKLQLKNFRTKVELACDPEDRITALNCLSAFIFLRFFCPAILNPKLFYLTKNHQTGTTQRTLTLMAKILLNLANRQEFSPHKEPHLVRLNDFLKSNQPKVYEYFDRITDRKNDFNEKILQLSHELKRFDLGLSGDKTSSELVTTPYLIDKYLRLTELINLLEFRKYSHTNSISAITSSSSQGTSITNGNNIDAVNQNDIYPVSKGASDINISGDVYQIGSLEFEKSEFLDLVGNNETEGFIKSLCRSNENIFSFITANITLKDLQVQSTNLMSRIKEVENCLEDAEYPENISSEEHWDKFTNDCISRCYFDTQRNTLVYFEEGQVPPPQYKRLLDNLVSSLKLKFLEQNSLVYSTDASSQQHSISLSFSSNSLNQSMKSKNPFKKWLKKN